MEYLGVKLRHELKYIINQYEYHYLRNIIKSTLKKDLNNKSDEGYHVRSLYFDDIYNTSFTEKEAGVKFRKKYRIRIYNLNDNVILFEKKTKYNQYISKKSEKLTRDDFYRILNKDFNVYDRFDNELFKEIKMESTINMLQPVVIVDYEREAYIHESGNVRITFDKNLCAGINSFDIFDRQITTKYVFDKPVMIMEIKFDSYLPSFINDLLHINNHYFTAASKYVMCRKIINNIKTY